MLRGGALQQRWPASASALASSPRPAVLLRSRHSLGGPRGSLFATRGPSHRDGRGLRLAVSAYKEGRSSAVEDSRDDVSDPPGTAPSPGGSGRVGSPVQPEANSSEGRSTASSRKRSKSTAARQARVRVKKLSRNIKAKGAKLSAEILGSRDSVEAPVYPPYALTVAQLSDLLELGVDAALPPPEELAQGLRTSLRDGLSGREARPAALKSRVGLTGCNRLPEPKQVTFWELLQEACSDFTILVLVASGVLSIILELALHSGPGGVDGGANWLEGAAILAAVVVVVAVSAVTNYQKEGQFRELNAAKSDIKVRVIRDGGEQRISIFDIVVGEVVLLEIGDILPADGVLFSGADIKVNESHLTGESDDVLKQPDADNKLYSGSQVLEGYGKMLVLAVGPNSQQGLISNLVARGRSCTDEMLRLDEEASLEQDTVLVQKLEAMAGTIGQAGLVAAIATTALMAATFSWQTFVVAGQPWTLDLLESYLSFMIIGITVLVVAVPEGLPLAVTLALAFSVRRMYEHQNLVRHLDACESLGCATTICSDKTGTLTQNRMEVVRLWLGGRTFRGTPMEDGNADSAAISPKSRLYPLRGLDMSGVAPSPRKLLFESIACNTTAQVYKDKSGEWVDAGNSTECALLRMITRLGLHEDCDDARGSHSILRTWTFTSARKRMTVLLRGPVDDQGIMTARAYSKGAADLMVQRCSSRMDLHGNSEPLTDEDRAELLSHAGKDALRMLCICYKDMQVDPKTINAMQEDAVEKDMVLVCMLGIQDDLRTGVDTSISRVQAAGVNVKMLTGDNLATAIAVARQASILPQDYPLPGGGLTMTLTSIADDHEEVDELALTGNGSRGPGETSTSGHPALDSWDSRCQTCKPESTVIGFSEEQLRKMAMEGPDFRRRVLREDGTLDADKFAEVWPQLRVLARCSPMDKYLLVQGCQALETNGLQAYREVVAMTGDGSNDAPALRLADVGLAMNSGTTIAKEASDIILMDNDFNTIVSGIKWGRGVYANITKFLQFQLTINIVAVVTACVGAAALQEAPLTAVQMLWVNLIMDSLASLSLATERPTNALLQRPPYRSDTPLITPLVAKHITGQAAYQLLVMYGLLFHGSALTGWDHDVAMTMVFNTFVFMQLTNQVNSRKIEDEPDIFEGFFSNRLFLGILAAEAVLQVAIVQQGGAAFRTTPLDGMQWAICAGFAAGTLLVRSVLIHVPNPTFLEKPGDKPSTSS